MSTQERVRQTLDDVTARVTALKERMIGLVAGFPDNPAGVKMLGPKCCVVSFSTVSENRGILSPSYYMTRDAKATLTAMIEQSSLETLGTRIEEILDTGRIKCSSSQTEKVCHEFLRALAELWYGGV
jgi:hypothetical protein